MIGPCGDVQVFCLKSVNAPPPAVGDPVPAPGPRIFVQQPDGRWKLDNVVCTVVAQAPLTPQMVSAEVVKLVPHVGVIAAPGTGRSLVNLETLFWADTAADRSLGTVALLGHQVTITIHAASVSWNFGDGTSATSDGPGRPFLDSDHCSTAQCPGWFGHTFAKTGAFTVTATVAWSGQYSVDGTAPQPIAGTVDGPAAGIPMQAVEARGVLVPNPH